MESGLKQRIIGALVLVVAAVIFLPMLLSGQDETVQVEVDVPPAPVMDDTDIAPPTPPTLPEPAPVPEIPGAPEGQPVAEPEQEIALIEPPPSAVTPPVEPSTDPAPVAASEGDWVVQQASFSSQSNAESFRQTLAGQGYNAYVRAAEVAGKQMHRVFVGPLSTREAAAQVRDELQRHHDNKGSVVAHNEATRAP